VPAANTLPASTELAVARTVDELTVVASMRVVSEATATPFTTLPAATTLASLSPPAWPFATDA